MEKAYTEAGMVEVEASGGLGLVGGMPAVTNKSLSEAVKPTSAQSLFYTSFDDPNPRFITEGIKAVAYRVLNGKAIFSDSPITFPLASRARLILVGDWGSGIERAESIAALMVEAAENAGDRQIHIVHLGDIYFCGWPDEAKKRFLDHWPVKPGNTKILSWCLNGNHDMYCGGKGYFEVVLGDSRFEKQGGCSYFALENEDWQILALDTAYEEWKLEGEQMSWALRMREKSPLAKAILMTHHQPFSDYEKEKDGESKRLLEILAPLLKGIKTAAWLWGHEHRAVVYKPHEFTFADGSKGQLPFGACLGNGGVPTHPTSGVPNATSLHVETGRFRVGTEEFGLFGFGILDFDGPSAELTVVNEEKQSVGPFKIA
jgi:hypothetical protein